MKKRILILAVLVALFVTGTALAVQPVDPGKGGDQGKEQQVFCNIEGNSGKYKVQIGGKGTEHEQPVYIDHKIVFAHDQHDVTAEMEAYCASLPEVLPPVGCKIGRVESYRDKEQQDPICVDDTGTTADDPNKGEVKSTTPTPVDDTVYPDFQGK